MIEQIIKKKPRTFQYGEIQAVNTVEGKAQVKLGTEGIVWIETDLSLSVGDAVIVARNEGSSRFIVQYSRKVIPSQGVLLLL